MGTPGQLFWGIMFGAIGSGYFIYWKKQQAFIPLCTGMVLCVFPYFVANFYLMLLIGIILALIPFFFKG